MFIPVCPCIFYTYTWKLLYSSLKSANLDSAVDDGDKFVVLSAAQLSGAKNFDEI